MSTRSNIIIKERESDREPLLLYRHCDGYPKGLGRDIEIAMRKVTEADKASKDAMRDFLMAHVPDVEIAEQMAGDSEFNYYVILSTGKVDWFDTYSHNNEILCGF